jgi:polysaccharide biosynthesis transport protein
METGGRAFEVKDYVRVFTKRKWFIVVITLAAGMLGGLYAVSYRPTYRAQSVVLIRRQAVERIQFTEEMAIESQNVSAQLTLDTQARIAKSYDVAQRTANKLGARESGGKIVADATEIVDSLEVFPEEPDRLVIRASNSEQAKALAFANETAETFVVKSAELRRADVAAAREFLETQIDAVSGRLDRLDRELAEYQHQVGIVVPQVEASAAKSQLSQYQRELDTALTNLATLQARRSTLQAQLSSAQPLIEVPVKQVHPERAMVEKLLHDEQVALTHLQSNYKENHPKVAEARRRIEVLQARLADLPATEDSKEFRANPDVTTLEKEIQNADLSIAETQQQINGLQAIVLRLTSETVDLPIELATIARLESQIELARSTYKTFLVQLEQSKLREEIKKSSAAVIDRAVTAHEVRPALGRMTMFALALGLFAGLMVALLLEALDDTFHSPEDLTHYTDVEFLGMVPMLETSKDELVTIASPKSPPAEAYRVLRSNIHFAQVDNPGRTFLVTSAGAGEGKSLTAANLAVVFAQAGQKVLVIDADLRRPSLQRLLHVDRERGLTNVLIGESTLDEVIVEVENVPGLLIVPTGPLPPNPADLLGSEQMSEVIREASELAEVVILDSPPAIVLTDAILLASKVDQTLLIAECEHVSRTAFVEMVRLIRHARGSVIGTILNKLRLSTSDYYYYYYYYYYDHAREEPVPAITESEAAADADMPLVEDVFGETKAAPERPEARVRQKPEAGMMADLFGDIDTVQQDAEPEPVEQPSRDTMDDLGHDTAAAREETEAQQVPEEPSVDITEEASGDVETAPDDTGAQARVEPISDMMDDLLGRAETTPERAESEEIATPEAAEKAETGAETSELPPASTPEPEPPLSQEPPPTPAPQPEPTPSEEPQPPPVPPAVEETEPTEEPRPRRPRSKNGGDSLLDDLLGLNGDE